MNKEKTFSQSDLISSTGNQISAGICLGLVCQWLISISKGITGDENQFWSDINGSLAKTENVPLLGKGYARQAIEFQSQYVMSLNSNPSTGSYTRTQLSNGGLSFDSAKFDASAGAFTTTNKNTIAARVLSETGRYNILGIRGDSGAHAIGIYRIYAAIGKSDHVRIFDPNIGLYTAQGNTDIQSVLTTIGNFYSGGLHASWLLETYK